MNAAMCVAYEMISREFNLFMFFNRQLSCKSYFIINTYVNCESISNLITLVIFSTS